MPWLRPRIVDPNEHTPRPEMIVPVSMPIATWNLNNRVGKVPFQQRAADAAVALDADVIAFTEYYPGTFDNHDRFMGCLRDAG